MYMLKAVIEELTGRFATANANSGRQRLRERTDNLVLDLLAALRTASLAEIAETTRALERRRKSRTSGRGTSNGSSAARKREVSSGAEASSPPAERPSAPRDPFDITVPSDLLEPTSSPAFTRTPRQGGEMQGVAGAPPARTEKAPPAGVSLRAGEELVRAGGSGAIIRRVRGT
jgi:hypothetical protein